MGLDSGLAKAESGTEAVPSSDYDRGPQLTAAEKKVIQQKSNLKMAGEEAMMQSQGLLFQSGTKSLSDALAVRQQVINNIDNPKAYNQYQLSAMIVKEAVPVLKFSKDAGFKSVCSFCDKKGGREEVQTGLLEGVANDFAGAGDKKAAKKETKANLKDMKKLLKENKKVFGKEEASKVVKSVADKCHSGQKLSDAVKEETEKLQDKKEEKVKEKKAGKESKIKLSKAEKVAGGNKQRGDLKGVSKEALNEVKATGQAMKKNGMVGVGKASAGSNYSPGSGGTAGKKEVGQRM